MVPHAVAADLCNEGLSAEQRVCAETIYQACYEPCGRRGLAAGSWRMLPRRRRRRKPRSRCEQAKRQPLGEIRLIAERSPEIEGRTEPGHSVRRPDHRRPQPLSGRDTHRTHNPSHSPGRVAQRVQSLPDRRSGLHGLLPRASCPAENAHLGPRKRDGQLVRHRTTHRSHRLFLRAPLALASGHQRTHQRNAPPMVAQRNQPQHRPNTPHSHRRQPQPHATTTPPLEQPPRPVQSPLELAHA